MVSGQGEGANNPPPVDNNYSINSILDTGRIFNNNRMLSFLSAVDSTGENVQGYQMSDTYQQSASTSHM